MRDEIRQPNRMVWMIVGVVALIIASLIVIAERVASPIRQEPAPPFSVRLFIPPSKPVDFDLAQALNQIKKTPKDVALLVQIQAYYASQQDWKRTFETGRTITRSPEGLGEANAYLGNIYALVNMGKLEEATEWAEMGLQKVSDRIGRAQLRRALGDLSLMHWKETDDLSYLIEAATHYQLALQEWEQVPRAKVHLAYVKFKLGELKLAKQLIDEVLQSSESTMRERAIATYYLAQIKASQGNITKADELYQRAQQMHPESFAGVESHSTRSEN